MVSSRGMGQEDEGARLINERNWLPDFGGETGIRTREPGFPRPLA